MPTTPHILIAHDHGLLRSLLVQLVAQIYSSATITAVTNGAEALNATTQHDTDLLITDNHMPGMSGADLIGALRAQQATCPILMVSSDSSLEAAALAVGANRFLCTPFSAAELQQVVTLLLPP
jgi:CheY-like chemotaxis protein